MQLSLFSVYACTSQNEAFKAKAIVSERHVNLMNLYNIQIYPNIQLITTNLKQDTCDSILFLKSFQGCETETFSSLDYVLPLSQ